MGYIDLHVHSTASDGTLTPAQVVAYGLKKQLAAIALTDHDTIDGVSEALFAASDSGLEVIPGIELSSVYQGTEIHILGFYADIHAPEFLSRLETIRTVRLERNEEMLRRFNRDGFSISMEELADGNPEAVITRAHFARVLTSKGYVSSMDQAFKKFLLPGSPYFPPRDKITPEQAMDILKSAGAFPALAHPLQYKLGWNETKRLILSLKEMGMKGLEVYHSSNNQYESGRLKNIAKDCQLLPTGGSDFHGSNKPDIDLGSGRGGLSISHLLLEDIKHAIQSAPDPYNRPAPSQNS